MYGLTCINVPFYILIGRYDVVVSMFSGLLGWLLGKNKGDDKVMLHVSEQKLAMLMSSVEGRCGVLETRIKKLEGSYGDTIKQLKQEIDDLAQENEALHSEQAAVQDMAEQRKRLMELAPGAMQQAGLPEAQANLAMQFLANPANVQMIDGMLAEYLPGMPVTTENLVQLIPVIKGLFASGGQKQQSQNPQY